MRCGYAPGPDSPIGDKDTVMISLTLRIATLFLLVAGTVTAEPHVLAVPITGMVDDGLRILVERAAKDIGDASALILEVDTPGGRVDSAIAISNAIIVRVGIKRVGVGFRVKTNWVGATMDFLQVAQTIVVGICVQWICAQSVFLSIGKAVAITVN